VRVSATLEREPWVGATEGMGRWTLAAASAGTVRTRRSEAPIESAHNTCRKLTV